MAAEVMPMLSMSMSAGEHNDRHNIDAEYRATLPNVDKSKTKDNENIKTETIEQAYERVFGAAVEEHNARQVASGHPERQIRDYLAKVRAELDADEKKRASGDKWRKNRPDPCIEYVAQLGSHGTWASEIDEDEAKAILRETYERVRDRTRGAIDWFQAVIHVDETDGTPRMHMAGIAIGTGYKRGMPMRVSMRKAFETMGVKDLPAMQALFLDTLEEVAGEHGIERKVMGCHEKHKPTRQYQQAMDEQQRINEKNERKRELGRELDALNAEKQDRLECLQSQIEETEPAAEGVIGSAGTLFAHLGDGSRERALAAEESSLAGEVEELEQQVRAAGEREEELEGQVRGLGDRVRDLGARLEHARMAVTEALKALTAEVPHGLSEIAKGIARKLNLPISGKDGDDEWGCDLDIEAMDARDVLETARVASMARQLTKDAGWQSTCDSPSHGRHQDR